MMRNFGLSQTAMTLAACLAILPAMAWAEDMQASIIAQLRAQGYGEFAVSTTFLGRLRIVATQGQAEREIVINPRTGEVLRDQRFERGSGGGDVGRAPVLRDDRPKDDRPKDDRPDDDRPDDDRPKDDRPTDDRPRDDRPRDDRGEGQDGGGDRGGNGGGKDG